MEQFDAIFKESHDVDGKIDFVENVDVFKAVRKFLFIFDDKLDKARFDRMCRYILATVLAPKFDTKISYVCIGCNKLYSVPWIHQMKSLLWKCAVFLKHIKPEIPIEHKSMMLYLNMLLTLTNSSSWRLMEPLKPVMHQLCVNIMNQLVAKGLLASLQTLLIKGLCRARPSLKKPELTALISIAIRPVMHANYSETSVNLFVLHILSVPALIRHLTVSSNDSIKLLNKGSLTLFDEALKLLSTEQNTRIIFNVLEGNVFQTFFYFRILIYHLY